MTQLVIRYCTNCKELILASTWHREICTICSYRLKIAKIEYRIL